MNALITERKEEIKKYANIAFNILKSNTNYSRNKKIISDIFKINIRDRFEKIFFRLTIIDSYYSTNMNKRLFGIDDIAKTLMEFSDAELKSKCKFVDLKNSKYNEFIKKLFDGNYGIHKNGKNAGHAYSLISKYLYFLTGYKFPIYDNLAQKSYELIEEKYNKLELEGSDDKIVSFFKKMKKLNKDSEINDYNKLDNFLWLIGKFSKGSFSLILDKEKYESLIKDLKISIGTNNNKIDKKIRNKIKNIGNLKGIFKANEIKFLKYTFNLLK